MHEQLDHGIFCLETGYQRPGTACCYLLVDHGEAAFIETGTAQLFGRAARGQEFDTLSGKSLSKFKGAAFVGKADQGLTDFHEEFSK